MCAYLEVGGVMPGKPKPMTRAPPRPGRPGREKAAGDTASAAFGPVAEAEKKVAASAEGVRGACPPSPGMGTAPWDAKRP